MDLGPVEELPALNSFHQRPADRQPNLKALRRFLAGLPADGPLVVLVTHQVQIAAITVPASFPVRPCPPGRRAPTSRGSWDGSNPGRSTVLFLFTAPV